MSRTPLFLYPARMTLDLTGQPLPGFSTLVFPWQSALDVFLDSLRRVDEKQNGKRPYPLKPPYRQLNDAILTLTPGLIHAFEDALDGKKNIKRMVAFSQPRYDEKGQQVGYEAYPSTAQLAELIKVWLELWLENLHLKSLIEAEWQTLKQSLQAPESDWYHNVEKPQQLLKDLRARSGLAYEALPALLTALLHGQSQQIIGANTPYTIQWRRANDGGKDGLHLVSQPFQKDEDYFAFRVDFSLQTQAGHCYDNGALKPWFFVRLSVQRYVSGKFQKDKFKKRNLAVLVGYNRERFETSTPQLWQPDTTLIKLRIKSPAREGRWADGVSQLLDRYGLRVLKNPATILETPLVFSKYANADFQEQDEYYPVFAEGRQFGEKGRRHHVETGLTYDEYSEIMFGIMNMLNGLLMPGEPFKHDTSFPQGKKVPFALRSYEFMSKKRSDEGMTRFRKASDEGLQRVLAHCGAQQFHIAVLYQSKLFRDEMNRFLRKTLLLLEDEMELPPFVKITEHYVNPMFYEPLHPGTLDPNHHYLRDQRPDGFYEQWAAQMRASYRVKREEWREFLRNILWERSACRMAVIESKGDKDAIHESQAIKGAVRDACHRESVASQFKIGGFKKKELSDEAVDVVSKKRSRKTKSRLSSRVEGELQNAALDLMLRQTGVLYGLPSEVYEKVAGISADISQQLDVIAFCRIKKNTPSIQYALAVRLSAESQVDIMLPGSDKWIPYLQAGHKLGRLFSDTRGKLNQRKHDLRLTQGELASFAHDVLTKHLRRPAIAVIEAEGWRNGPGDDETEHGWKQLRNPDLLQKPNVLDFGRGRFYERAAPGVQNLIAVVRLRMNKETPQYVTQAWHSEEDMLDVPHLTAYADTGVQQLLHYFSIAGLPEMQKKQRDKNVSESYKLDPKNPYHEIAIKHAQAVELVPFFVRNDFRNDEGKRQLCRAVHFLRVAPGFTMGEVLHPYPMHLGDKLLKDQLCIVGAE